ncbi:MAG: CDP-archaeol synthase [Chloroflexi bacterium]|nr:CDP-archaeol synthase [Chloroflexota bacterium]
MRQRIVTALCGIPILLAFVWLETPWFPALVILAVALAILAALEFYRLSARAGARPLTIFGIGWCVLYVVSAHIDVKYDVDYVGASLLGLAVVLPFLWLFLIVRRRDLLSWAWTVGGILYVGWMLGHYVALRELSPSGREWVIVVLFSTFACDTAAFFVGRRWGRRRLAPRISPGKTWEGSAAGFVAAPVAALIICVLFHWASLALSLDYGQAALLGCLIGVVAQVGDLFESLLKRRAGVKDSGRLMPGHGGILDRIDSLLFVGVGAYYYIVWVVL